MPTRSRLTWIHLSDVHFGHGDASHRFDQGSVGLALLQKAKKMAQVVSPPELILVTGDVAFSGQHEQYKAAKAWFAELCAVVGGKPQLFFVPGNHDIDRGLARAGDPDGKLRTTPEMVDALIESPEKMEPVWRKLEEYSKFAAEFDAPKLDAKNPFYAKPLPDRFGKVFIVGLNTALLCRDGDDSPKNLGLGNGQLQKVIDNLPEDALLLVLQHHPPAWLLDGRKLKRRLSQCAHICFSGHVHKQRASISTRFGVGSLLRFSAGAVHKGKEEKGSHAFAWGQLDEEGLTYHPMRWQPELGRFVSDVLCDQDDSRSKDSILVKREQLPQRLAQWLRSAPSSAVGSTKIESTSVPVLRADDSLPHGVIDPRAALFIRQCSAALKSLWPDIDRKRYVRRQIEDGLEVLKEHPGPTIFRLVLAPAGSGKTSLCCHLAASWGRGPVLLLSSATLELEERGGLFEELVAMSKQLRQPLFGHDAESILAALDDAAHDADENALIIVDSVNEHRKIAQLVAELERLIKLARGRRVRFLITCRDRFASAFDKPFWRSGLINEAGAQASRESQLFRFSDREWQEAAKKYLEEANWQMDLLSGDAAAMCRHPLLLRLFVEAYEGTQFTATVTDLHLEALFKAYWEKKRQNLRTTLATSYSPTERERRLEAIEQLVPESARHLMETGRDWILFSNSQLPFPWQSTVSAAACWEQLASEAVVLVESPATRTSTNKIRFTFEMFEEYQAAASMIEKAQNDPDAIAERIEQLVEQGAAFINLVGPLLFVSVILPFDTSASRLWARLLRGKKERISMVLKAVRQVPDTILGRRFDQFLLDALRSAGAEDVRFIVSELALPVENLSRHAELAQFVAARIGSSDRLMVEAMATLDSSIAVGALEAVIERTGRRSNFHPHKFLEAPTGKVFAAAGLALKRHRAAATQALQRLAQSNTEIVREYAIRALGEQARTLTSLDVGASSSR